MELRFTRTARRHRIGKAHAQYVMATCRPEAYENSHGELALSWIGEDERGVELEIAAVMKADIHTGRLMILVFHVMPTQFRR